MSSISNGGGGTGIRGIVAGGSEITAGKGFTVKHPATGKYEINLTSEIPNAVVLISPESAERTTEGGQVSGLVAIVRTYKLDGVTAANGGFCFSIASAS